MSQVLHILKKDVRYLRNEIGLMVVLSFLYTWVEFRSSSFVFQQIVPSGDILGNANLFEATGVFLMFFIAVVSTMLIGLVIQAEAIAGDKQFWITRPYRWHNLLAAKLLFILLFVNLPIFAGRLLIVVMDGIPLTPALTALALSQVWLFSIIGLSTAAVAALTPGLSPFIFSMMTLWFAGTVGIGLFQNITHWPQTMYWIRDLVSGAAVVGCCCFILYVAYRSRRTLIARVVGLSAVVAVMIMYRYVPLSLALGTQTGLSSQHADWPAVHVSITPVSFFSRSAGLSMDIEIDGVANGLEANDDVASVVFQAADGRTWEAGQINLDKAPAARHKNRATVYLDRDFAAAEHDKPLTITASVYLTMYGNSRTRQISFGDSPVSVIDDLVCIVRRGPFVNSLHCRSVATLSKTLVLVPNFYGTFPLQSRISYAPYPSGIAFDPVEGYDIVAPTRDFTFIAMEPVAHLQRDARASGIRLDDIRVDPK